MRTLLLHRFGALQNRFNLAQQWDKFKMASNQWFRVYSMYTYPYKASEYVPTALEKTGGEGSLIVTQISTISIIGGSARDRYKLACSLRRLIYNIEDNYGEPEKMIFVLTHILMTPQSARNSWTSTFPHRLLAVEVDYIQARTLIKKFVAEFRVDLFGLPGVKGSE